MNGVYCKGSYALGTACGKCERCLMHDPARPKINSRGESGQDYFAFEQCGFKKDGTFIDIGCNEPIRWNNTFALEQIGWRGICIDIEKTYAPMYREREATFVIADARNIDWPTLLEKDNFPPQLDYLSLDIDEDESRGITLRILENIFNDGLTFRCMTVEHDAYRFGDNPRQRLRELIQANGYKLYRANVEIGQFRGGDPNWKGNGKSFEDWWVKI